MKNILNISIDKHFQFFFLHIDEDIQYFIRVPNKENIDERYLIRRRTKNVDIISNFLYRKHPYILFLDVCLVNLIFPLFLMSQKKRRIRSKE